MERHQPQPEQTWLCQCDFDTETLNGLCVRCGRVVLYDLPCPEERLLDAIFNPNSEKGE